ncbi:unnamed protein product [Penicillium salamii]|uniref:Uncharacterized protein n=1 Tax=Penicillium salamii TaxID=1612424 RepID=A0A9W4NST6_9EURO|nr:unnamed protein product [Penicillium salamii]CAG8005515.1 unnamed protein product [Penicillium salamii]CAG8251053.1 unnamed protein product [Penicillium salamii]CAG8273236.1 unnamed protein product [Penicillium salamii]CAG8308967.1 unnamed protein product [Penicillium salamii]
MSWDRVIQDSDEDEPLEGDAPPTVAPNQRSEPAVQEYHDHVPAKLTTHNANEHGSVLGESMLPQLNVNFDEYLQSQERNNAGLSSSQQRREERWIPSTDGASGSMDGSGTMMSEIGLAQQRLLDDNASSAGQQIPSAGASFSAESIQSAPFPTIPSSHSYQMGPPDGEHFPYYQAPHDMSINRNQALLPDQTGVYGLNQLGANNDIAPNPNGALDQPTAPWKEYQHAGLNPPQAILHSRSQQPFPQSPHDTEPISSVASRQDIGFKSSTVPTNLISPQQSQSSAQDELALPAVQPILQPIAQAPAAIEPPVPKKKRGRPKKQALPINDEDDELANSRDHEFKTPGVNGAIDQSDSEYSTENDTPASSGVSNQSDEEEIGTAKTRKSESQDSTKKKPKKSKSKPAPVPVPGSGEDDVIWIDTKSIDAAPVNDSTNLNQEQEPTEHEASSITPITDPAQPSKSTAAAEPTTQTADEKPAPKKRGRKRKQPIEEEAPKPADTPAPTDVGAQTPGPKLAVVVDNSPKSAPVTDAQSESPAKEPNTDTVTAPTEAPSTTNSTTGIPQTPSKPDTGSINTPKNTGKGPEKHSPISARGGVPYRVGLSKRARIAPLLKMVRK